MELCLIGGTFDPPHWGHLLLAESVRDQYSLEKIVFIPAFIPPHKQDEKISKPEHRISMLQLLADENPGFAVDRREIDRTGVSYTIDTISEIRKEQGLAPEHIGFLIGADNFLDLESWKDSDTLVEECRILVAQRPDFPLGETDKYTNSVEFLNLPKIAISSTLIRDRVAAGKTIRYYVLPSVEEYIQDNQLYQ